MASDREVLAVPHAPLGRSDDALVISAVVLALQPGYPVEQGLQADADEVGQHRVVGSTGAWVATANDLSGNPDHHGAERNLFDHNGVGADPAVVADLDRAEHLGSGPDHHAITDGRVAFAGVSAGAPEGDAVEERDVV